MKKGLIIYALLALMALPALLQSCASKRCGCMGNLNNVPYKQRNATIRKH
jgi:hypothetical protein